MKLIKRLLLITLALVILLEIWNLFSVFLQDKKYHQDLLSNLSVNQIDAFEYIRENASRLIDARGLEDTVVLTREAFKDQLITMYECHTLAHLLGHKSDLDVKQSFQMLERIGIDYCGGGFKHGIEAEIALKGLTEGTDFRSKLYELCEFLSRKSRSGCYHGAGHEFLAYTMNPTKALALCDTLTGGLEEDLTLCYTGVFSEYTNQLGGTDGETGYRLKGGPRFFLEVHPVEFCATFEEKFQIPCAHEVSGLKNDKHPNLQSLENSFMRCVNQVYKDDLQEACVRSVAGVSTQHALAGNSTITPPTKVLLLPEYLRRAYIRGVTNEMFQYISNGVKKDWKSFCENFPGEDYKYCATKFLN